MSSTRGLFAGRYRMEGRLGVGGMSTVMLAFDERLERNVAVKLLAEHLADDPAFVSRFRREALAAARLIHPNIVQVFDFGLDSTTHQHFIVMEHVRGRSCAELLRERGHLDVGQGVEIIIQACRGLDYAHRNGVVHRDVKPGNLLLSDSGGTKLADFGIARATDQSSITQVGSVLGTAAYLAPEQARGELAGPQSDLYSLGVVSYQLLSGRLPYEAGSLSELALKQQRELPRRLDELNPSVGRPLAEAVSLAIAIDPAERPETAQELAQIIEDAARGVSPYAADSPTRSSPSTAATRMLGTRGGGAQTASTRVAAKPRKTAVSPRQVPAGRRPEPAPLGFDTPPPTPRPTSRPARTAAPAAARRRSGAGRFFGRLLLVILALAVVAVLIGVAAILLVNKADKSVVHYQQVVGHDAHSAISQLNSIISKYTGK